MNTEHLNLVTWFVDPRAVQAPRSRARQADFSSAGSREYVYQVSLKPSASMVRGTTPCSCPKDEKEVRLAPVIVTPLDFSPASSIAAEVSASVARHTQADVIFCHAIFPKVIPFGPASPPWVFEALRDEAVQKMQPFLRIAQEAGVSATCVVDEGTPAGLVLKLDKRYRANLIILTAREHSVWARLLFGPTIAERIAREAECHVMVVRAALE